MYLLSNYLCYTFMLSKMSRKWIVNSQSSTILHRQLSIFAKPIYFSSFFFSKIKTLIKLRDKKQTKVKVICDQLKQHFGSTYGRKLNNSNNLQWSLKGNTMSQTHVLQYNSLLRKKSLTPPLNVKDNESAFRNIHIYIYSYIGCGGISITDFFNL